ncbi:sigma 54-interacting transcriptional regulator, partial [Mycobacterium tuberculosis]|nr:sigma 54-interacting transcriptional regulator [Mycobacterium tuberculosis]
IQEREVQRVGSNQTLAVDVRLIAATHRNLAEEVSAGRFRQDLYYRLNVVTIEIPPLRRRREDIPQLAQHFLKRYTERNRKTVK